MHQVKERRQRLTKALTLSGQFDHRTMSGIQAMIEVAQETGRQDIVLDFSSVTDIDSSSLSELFLWYHKMKAQQLQIRVVRPSPYIRYHEDWMHLAEIVSIYRSLDEAMDQEDLS